MKISFILGVVGLLAATSQAFVTGATGKRVKETRVVERTQRFEIKDCDDLAYSGGKLAPLLYRSSAVNVAVVLRDLSLTKTHFASNGLVVTVSTEENSGMARLKVDRTDNYSKMLPIPEAQDAIEACKEAISKTDMSQKAIVQEFVLE